MREDWWYTPRRIKIKQGRNFCIESRIFVEKKWTTLKGRPSLRERNHTVFTLKKEVIHRHNIYMVMVIHCYELFFLCRIFFAFTCLNLKKTRYFSLFSGLYIFLIERTKFTFFVFKKINIIKNWKRHKKNSLKIYTTPARRINMSLRLSPFTLSNSLIKFFFFNNDPCVARSPQIVKTQKTVSQSKKANIFYCLPCFTYAICIIQLLYVYIVVSFKMTKTGIFSKERENITWNFDIESYFL